MFVTGEVFRMRTVFQVLMLLVFGLATMAGAVEDNVAGKCMTCHKEKSPGLYR